jgi:hypothetical protein
MMRVGWSVVPAVRRSCTRERAGQSQRAPATIAAPQGEAVRRWMLRGGMGPEGVSRQLRHGRMMVYMFADRTVVLFA